ncbi:MAG: DnaB helicase C-terminal domain-containing protein [Actinobacteria bacterium]|nr:DnaB helicase C-terminal domain-containing protein [Actinomycetota bacterium]
MREGFLALFRNAEPTSGTDRSSLARAISAFCSYEPSTYLRRYSASGSYSSEPVSSGFPHLDNRLSGGFGAGLHLMAGKPGVGKTAFLESVAWENISEKRPVLYYTLKEDGLAVWQRLIFTAGQIIGDRMLSMDDLRAHALSTEDRATLASLDRSLQVAVLPYMSLLEAIPASSDGLGAFVKDASLRAHEAADKHGRNPLVLMDDLDRLLLLTRVRPASHVLSVVDETLAADSLTGIIVATIAGSLDFSPEKTEVRTASSLVAAVENPTPLLRLIDLSVQLNRQTGWTGSIPLVLDAHSGLLLEAPDQAEDGR